MRTSDPSDVLRVVLAKVGGVDWTTAKNRLREELVEYLTDDLFEGDYEFVNVPAEATLSEVVQTGENQVEITVKGSSLPDKAILVRDANNRWHVKSFWGQCTGCLGTGQILNRPCNSCSGTGWGLRPT